LNPEHGCEKLSLMLPRVILLSIGLFLATGCGYGKFSRGQSTLQIHSPQAWLVAQRVDQRQIAQGWLKEFHHAPMQAVVREALQSNQDLQATASRLRVVKELSIQARAQRLPRLNASSTSAWTQADGVEHERYGLSLGASWELDLWGRLRDLHRATVADLDAAVADFRSAQLSLAAATAKSYCNMISAQQQWQLAVTTRDSFEKNLRIIERNYKAGVPNVRALDVQLGRSNVSQARRSEKARALDRDNAIRSLEVLLGRYPATAMQPVSQLPQLDTKVTTGLPAALLERRPDLQAARSRILSSALRTDAARKNRLPGGSLLGSASLSEGEFSRVINPADLASNVLVNLSQVLYAGGALEAEVNIALARNEAAIHDYAQQALTAFREVESTLAAEKSLSEQEVDLKKEVEQAALAERQAERDYSEGIDGVDILSVLESQRRANNARSALIRLQNERLQNRVDLYLALGGSI
jgi:multidrug efflux system outer membrane protein